jgi:hypothetical protein
VCRANFEFVLFLLMVWLFSLNLVLHALRSTQPLTGMSTRNLPEGKGRPARKVDKFTAICETIV